MEREIRQLDELMNGALTERFNREMARVLENVFDPNTKAKAKRQIQIIVDITPNDRRDTALFKLEVKSKLVPAEAIDQTVMLNLRADGSVTATEITREVPGQMDIDGNAQPMPSVVEFSVAKEN